MQDIDTTSTQSLIDRYYEEEKAQREREQTLAALNMRLDANDLAMLNVIARRFRKTRDEVAQEVLSTALIDLFARVEAGERKLMARDADDAARSIADDIAEENGVATPEIKTGVWANHDRQITKLERKKAKQQEQEEAEKKQLQAALAAAGGGMASTDNAASAEALADASDENAADDTAEEHERPAAAMPASESGMTTTAVTEEEESDESEDDTAAPVSVFAG